jgi:hypothetical protein
MGNQDLGRDDPGESRQDGCAATTKAAQTLTLLPSVGSPDRKLAIKLMAPVVISIWEKNRDRGNLAERIEDS